MARNYTCSVICLRVRPAGESNREAWFLSAEEGVFKALVFGGPKSRLRAMVSPFHQGRLWVYHDPVRDSRKASDFDVEAWRPGLREVYGRAIAADAVAETVLATHGGGGSWNEAVEITGKTLDCLESADEKICSRILVSFYWAWAGFLGIRPELDRCASCACEIKTDEVSWYDTREGSLSCGNCRGGQDFAVGPGTRRWLTALGGLDPKEALRYSLDKPGLIQARAFVLSILTGALGRRLSLWDE